MLTKLSAILEDLELSASLVEKNTLMEEFIFTLSSCSRTSIRQEMYASLMWADATQMLFVVGEHLKRVTIMRQKMETLLQEASSGRAEREFLHLAGRGLRFCYQEHERNFLQLARTWLLGHYSVVSPPSDVTQTGDIDQSLPDMPLLEDFDLIRADTQSSMLGWDQTWEQINLVSDPGGAFSFLAWGC